MTEHPLQIPAINLTGTDPSIPGWHRESTFLMAYPPEEDPANIFVIGAFGGVIAGLLIEQESSRQHFLFEPQDWACRQLEAKFGWMTNVHIRRYALGDRTGILRMGLYQTDECSFMRGPVPFKDVEGPGGWYNGEMVKLDDFMWQEQLSGIYYASINIEGYEYVLLPHMVWTGWIARTQILGISWHDARFNSPQPGKFTYLGQPVPDYEEIQDLLSQTHELVLSIDNWQSWVRRPA